MSSFEFVVADQSIETKLSPKGKGWVVTVEDTDMEIIRVDEHRFKVSMGKKDTIVTAAYARGIYYIEIDAIVYELKEPPEDDFSGSSEGSVTDKDKVFAPMPGKIVSIMVSIGDKVSEKQTLAVVEAMKMENPILAKAAGIVKAINCAEGDQVDTEKALVELDLDLDPKAE